MTSPDEYQPSAQVMTRSRVKWLDQLGSIPTYEGFQQSPANHRSAETLGKGHIAIADLK
jgi:hypothetical protein